MLDLTGRYKIRPISGEAAFLEQMETCIRASNDSLVEAATVENHKKHLQDFDGEVQKQERIAILEATVVAHESKITKLQADMELNNEKCDAGEPASL